MGEGEDMCAGVYDDELDVRQLPLRERRAYKQQETQGVLDDILETTAGKIQL